MHSSRLLFAGLFFLVLVIYSSGGNVKSEEFYTLFAEYGPTLKMDQALLAFHNQLTEQVQVFYTSDYCYKCVKQPLVTVKPNNNAPAAISTKFTLTLQVESQTRNATLCRWSQIYEEGGHYSVRIQMPAASTNPICHFSVDRSPNNAYLRKYKTPNEDSDSLAYFYLLRHIDRTNLLGTLSPSL
ncbi:hypothetical protein GOODEAATRI_027627 [Goodea atripinnis]|uniref:Secreted protein n=1 Tax=Goodea atripinnis TaxID=208336 RepID=A0ABV0MXN5_9TELE